MRSRWSGVAAARRHGFDVGPVGECALGRVDVQHLAAAAGREPLAQRGQQPRRVGARRARRGRRVAATAPARPGRRGRAVELDRVAVGALVLVAPGHEPVVFEHDRARVGVLGRAPRELEARPQVRHERDVGARAPRATLAPALGVVRERADGVRVRVVDVARRQKGVQQRLDRRPPRGRVGHAVREVARPSRRRSSRRALAAAGARRGRARETRRCRSCADRCRCP